MPPDRPSPYHFPCAALVAFVAVTLAAPPVLPGREPPANTAREGQAEYDRVVAPFLARHCIRCHGEKKQAGDVRLDRLTADAMKNAELWLSVRDQVRDGLMPPGKEPRPADAEARSVVNWVSRATGGRAARLPHQGNLLPHELLFGTTVSASEPPRRASGGSAPPATWASSAA